MNSDQLAALVRASDPAKDYDRGVLDLVAAFVRMEAEKERLSQQRVQLRAVLELAFKKRDHTAPEITFDILREALAPKAGT
jgi:hypothetical protein